MTKDELLDRLKRLEWNYMEFKKSQHGVSEDAYRTVSAFTNTNGGTLIFLLNQRSPQGPRVERRLSESRRV